MILHPKATIESRILTLADAIDQHLTPWHYRWELVGKGALARNLSAHNDTLRWISDGEVWHNGARYYQDRFTWGPGAIGTRVMVTPSGIAVAMDDTVTPAWSCYHGGPITNLVRK